jgi:THO complex subunit 4
MADSDKLALGLDDIIRSNRATNRRGGGGNRGFRGRTGRGGGSGFRNRGGGGIPRTLNTPAAGRWKHDLYENNGNQNRGAQRNVGVNSTTKLLISNLDFGVTTNDIQELFEDVGALRTARVHYDESGRSLGTAEVVFERRVDAVSAQQKYNTLNLDGRPMDIRLVGGVDDGSRPQSNRFSLANGGGRNQRFGNRNNNQQNGNRGGNRARGGKQQNSTGNKKEDITADDLDAELDAYRAESKQKKQ